MFENLREKGEALRNLFKKDKDKDDEKDESIVDKTVEVIEARDKEAEKTDVEKLLLGKTDDTAETESIIDVLKKEEAEKKEEKDDDLDKKLKNIEKVLETFGDSGGTSIGKAPKSPFSEKDVIKINEPVDFSSLMAKDFISPFLLNKPSSQSNRVELLYETLKKQNLI
tara:strand:+ start:682 stop:1185 length:504 start_codon:yes stop_codon:yes gene_type:complete